MKRTFVGDIVIVRLRTGIVLTDNTSLVLKYERPDKTTGRWDASVNPDVVTKAQYMTTGADLNIPGTWRVQAYAEFSDWRGHGLWAEIKVYEPIYRS